MDKGEDRLVAWLFRQFDVASSDITAGIGDDLAVVNLRGEQVLIGVDMLMDGTHFDTRTHRPEEIGRKALAVSLSDCAAMAARPRFALVSVALPNDWTMDQAQALLAGVAALARRHGCSIIGGDTNSWDRPLVIDVTVVAQPYDGAQVVLRNGVLAGDELFVTGALGGSLLGRHMSFEPRLEQAHELSKKLGPRLHAMMDLSDGLSTDAPRMAAASGCGLVFETEALQRVISKDAEIAAGRDGRSALDHALNDGEDFELLFAVEPGAMASFESRLGGEEKTPITKIGRAVPDTGVWLLATDGAPSPLIPAGWQHFR